MWRALFDRPVRKFDVLGPAVFGLARQVPRHPFELARFGMPTVLPGSVLARFFRLLRRGRCGDGIAAHTFRPLNNR